MDRAARIRWTHIMLQLATTRLEIERAKDDKPCWLTRARRLLRRIFKPRMHFKSPQHLHLVPKD
ncbi:MAG TPA: hypothetical protein VGE56_00780 [Rhodocyclaceae bacterium]